MMYIGIDPGLNGAIAALSDKGLIVLDLPVKKIIKNGKKKHEINGPELARIIDDFSKVGRTSVFIEHVGAMPGNGSVSMFSFGDTYGTIKGICDGLFLERIPVFPKVWKAAVGLPPKADKEASRAKATEFFPANQYMWPLKKHDGRAEAALIAWYGRKISTENC